jgi:octaprenyl-diphosphate synthase
MRVMEVLSEATNIIAEGEVLQLMNCNDPDIDEAAYLRSSVTRQPSCSRRPAGSAPSSMVRPEIEDALGNYGMHLGTAFQIIDDVLDYSGETKSSAKNVGDDLAEGKPTLPLLFAMKHGTPEESGIIRAAILQGDASNFQRILNIVQRTGALDHAHRRPKPNPIWLKLHLSLNSLP